MWNEKRRDGDEKGIRKLIPGIKFRLVLATNGKRNWKMLHQIRRPSESRVLS